MCSTQLATHSENEVGVSGGRRLSYVPRISFNAWMTYQLPARLTLGGGAQFTDGYFFNNSNALAIQGVSRHLHLQVNATFSF